MFYRSCDSALTKLSGLTSLLTVDYLLNQCADYYGVQGRDGNWSSFVTHDPWPMVITPTHGTRRGAA